MNDYKNMTFDANQICIQILTSLVTSSVTLGKILSMCPGFLISKLDNNAYLTK